MEQQFDGGGYKYTYDENDEIKTATSKDGTATFTYNKYGDVTAVKDANGETLKYEYDTIGRKTALIYPDGTRVTYRYDDTNQLTDVIEADGKKTTYDYDANGLPLAIHYSNGTKTTYRYSAIGETEHVETSNKSGKVIASFDYVYDENGNVTKETINQNGTKQVKTHTYDADDQLKDTTVKAGKNTEVITYIYDANGNRTKLKRVKNGKKTIEDYHYDDDNVLAMIQADGDADTTYTHDKNGNITKKALRSGKVETYTYNGENQLIQSADNKGHVTTYSYDAFGNRIGKETITDKTKEVQGTLSEWITTYDKQAKDKLKVTPGKTATEGTSTKETTTKEEKSKQESLTKQLEKRADGTFEGCPAIAKDGADVVTKEDGTTTTTKESTASKDAKKVKDGIQGKTELKESDGNSSTSTERTTETAKSVGYQAISTIRYINDLTQEYTQVAQLDETTEDNGETTETSTDYRFGEDDQILGTEDESYHENGLTDIATTSDGEESTDYDYTDYGTAIAAVPMANQIGYRAQMHDTNDTQNLRARNYDTNTGRFLQADSYRGALDDPRTQNRYIYGGNNPNSYSDPSGHFMNWLKKKAKKFKKKAKKAAKKLKKSIKKGIKKVKKAIKRTVKKVKRVIKKIKRAAKKVYKKIKRAVKKVATKVKRAVKKFKRAATKSIKQIHRTAKKVYKKAKTVVQKKIQKVKRSVKKKITTIKKAGLNFLAKAKTKIKVASIVNKIARAKAKVVLKAKLNKASKKYAEKKIANQLRAQKNWKSVCSGTSALGAGFVDGLASNGTFGMVGTLNKNDQAYGDNNLYHIGKILSDIGSIAVGGVGMAGGGALAGVGVGLDVTGAGAVIGVPANIAGVAIASGSAAVATSGTQNIVKDASDLISNIKSGKNSEAEKIMDAASIKWKGFSKGELGKHYTKHGKEFGDITQSQYLQEAKNFAKESGSGIKETKVGNFVIKFDSKTQRVLVGQAKSKEIRTFYKADGRNGDPYEAAIKLAKELSGIK